MQLLERLQLWVSLHITDILLQQRKILQNQLAESIKQDSAKSGNGIIVNPHNGKIIAMASIGSDHCEYLGHTLKEITFEKASAITPQSIVVSGPQVYEVERKIEKLLCDEKTNVDEKKGRNLKLHPLDRFGQTHLGGPGTGPAQ